MEDFYGQLLHEDHKEQESELASAIETTGRRREKLDFARLCLDEKIRARKIMFIRDILDLEKQRHDAEEKYAQFMEKLSGEKYKTKEEYISFGHGGGYHSYNGMNITPHNIMTIKRAVESGAPLISVQML